MVSIGSDRRAAVVGLSVGLALTSHRLRDLFSIVQTSSAQCAHHLDLVYVINFILYVV
jgi:hypothetical protein